jgi:hypothetical protein
VLAVSCTPSDAAALLALPPSGFAPCASPSCVLVPASIAAPLALVFALAAQPLATPVSVTLSCTVASTSPPRSTGAPLPVYAARTTLPPLAISSLPGAFHLLVSVLIESSVVPGTFTAVGGAGAGAAFTASLPDTSADAACIKFLNSTAKWASPSLPACAPALASLRALAAAVLAAPAPPSLAVTLSGATRLLLVASPAGALFTQALVATLRGLPCVVN